MGNWCCFSWAHLTDGWPRGATGGGASCGETCCGWATDCVTKNWLQARVLISLVTTDLQTMGTALFGGTPWAVVPTVFRKISKVLISALHICCGLTPCYLPAPSPSWLALHTAHHTVMFLHPGSCCRSTRHTFPPCSDYWYCTWPSSSRSNARAPAFADTFVP